MSYRVAAASSDGMLVDTPFGEAESFLIYEIRDDGTYELIEKRIWVQPDETDTTKEPSADVVENPGGTAEGHQPCGCAGANSEKTGCTAAVGIAKIRLIEDCRCVFCSKIGFKIRRQLERRAIAIFDLEIPLEDALQKIVSYFARVDAHQSLRGIANGGKR
jgi:predicted Fe-Mo cluster-binding NifX family protein